VLLADDEPRLLRPRERLLAQRGHPVATARDGDEALRASARAWLAAVTDATPRPGS
jgi:CheY-like chemotaxis protein